MKPRIFVAASILAVALSGTGYAACTPRLAQAEGGPNRPGTTQQAQAEGGPNRAGTTQQAQAEGGPNRAGTTQQAACE